MLYFAEVKTFNNQLDSEMEKVKMVQKQEEDWTYPLIQPLLFERVKLFLFIELFYETLSFDKDTMLKGDALKSLFIKEAILTDQSNKKVQSVVEYIDEFNQIIKDYPILFNKGFHERQIEFDVMNQEGLYKVSSKYEKKYQRNGEDLMEYGINYMTIQILDDDFKIMSISYLDGVQ